MIPPEELQAAKGHTPEPWTVKHINHDGGDVTWQMNSGDENVFDCGFVAYEGGGVPPKPEDTALIALAPRLLQSHIELSAENERQSEIITEQFLEKANLKNANAELRAANKVLSERLEEARAMSKELYEILHILLDGPYADSKNEVIQLALFTLRKYEDVSKINPLK